MQLGRNYTGISVSFRQCQVRAICHARRPSL